MYGLKQAARLALDMIREHLKKYGYEPSQYAPNIWSHQTRKTKFCLCVDDFAVKYFNKADADHLINALKEVYDITVDWKGQDYCGLKIEWDYKNAHVDISMPTYTIKALQRLQHPFPKHPQHAPHKWILPNYNSRVQYAQDDDKSQKLDKKGIKQVQQIIGTFLYYGRAVDNTILPALNDISQSQASPTTNTLQATNMLHDYLATHPKAKIRFHASPMILHVDTDAAYLVASKARSRIAGYFYMSDKYVNNTKPNPTNNGPVHVECHLLRHVVSSAAEAETTGLFFNCQTAINIRHMLEALGHPQPPTPIRTDNSIATSFANSTFTPKRSKSWDMRYHWLKDKVATKDFYIYLY